jgi:hypothetical protein
LFSPAINLSPVSTTPAITEDRLQGFIAGIVDTGISVIDTGEQLIASVVDIDDKHSFGSISANF